MICFRTFFSVSVVASAAVLSVWADAAAADLALKRVMLSTGGVGYFEYEAQVGGDADLTLEVRRDQVDDVLKSIVVYDDKGGIGTIGLPGQEPLREAFRELPFPQTALTSPVALLDALRGAEVRVAGPREIAGRLIGVTEETTALPDGGGTVVRHRVGLLTSDGVRQVILEETDALRFADPQLQAQVEGALAAIARHGERDRRTLTIRTLGAEPRTVRVGYVVGAPLWKATYRLTLGGSSPQGADLQGWAVLENLSGEIWRDIDLTIISGNPVTFRQALYEAYFVDRPEVPVEVLGRVLPRVDEGGRPAPAMAAAAESAPGMQALKSAPPSPAPMADATMNRMAPAPQRLAPVTAAQSTEATTQVVFHYPRPVSVPSGNSLLLPIVGRSVPAERIGLYQRDAHPRHPLAAVRLINDGPSGLPPGVLTLYERDPANAAAVAYVGDARLGALPAGEERLVSFAIDQKVTVDQTRQDTQALTQARIVDGILQLTRTERAAAAYTVSGAAREDRTVIVEHPRLPGWTLTEPIDPRPEATAEAYRLRLQVPAGQTRTARIVQERPRLERIELATLPAEEVVVYASATELPPAIRDALATLSGLRAAIADRQRTLETLENRQGDLVRDQERVRQNLEAAPADSDLHRRFLAKLGEQEDRLEQVKDDIARARTEVEAAETALLAYVRGLKL